MTAPAPIEALRRLPLVPRPHPVRAPLDERLAEIRRLADSDSGATDSLTAHALTARATGWNHAALLASDHHLPDLARRLCWEHHHRYQHLRSWDDRTARLAIEPLINLARLHLRDRYPDTAITLLAALRSGVHTRTDTTIDGCPVRMSRITADPGEHRRLRTWMWSVLLAEGIRGLAAAGRWADALAHAHRHHGVGHRLLDGRQTAVVTHLATGEPDTARHLVDHSDLREPWEHAIAATLRCAIDLTTGDTSTTATATAMIEHYLAVDLDQRHATFTDRLGDTVDALTHQAGRPDLAARLQPRLAAPIHRPPTTPGSIKAATLTEQLLGALGVRS